MLSYFRSARPLFGAVDNPPAWLPEHDLEEGLRSLCALPKPEANGQRPKIPSEKFPHIVTYLHGLDQLHKRSRKDSWCLRPRIYTILRGIGALSFMSDFITHELNDISLPFDWQTLPSFFAGDEIRQAFLENQESVLTDARKLESTKDHIHFTGSADEHFIYRAHLGQGGFGAVDAVISKLSLTQYARKRLHRGKDSQENRRAHQFFVEEIMMLKALSYRHLVKITGSYTDPRYIAYLMEPVAETNLAEFLRGRRLSSADVVSLRHFFGCLAGAVDYLHAHNIRHRDLKPQNVLVKDGTVYLADFGAALDWSGSKKGTTQDRNAPATPDYMAPEVAERAPRNASSDMWSLGLVFLDMVTVLKGYSLVEWKEHIRHKARVAKVDSHPYKNLPAVNEWMSLLQKSDRSPDLDNEPLMWIKELLQLKPDNRPSSKSLVHEIADSPYFHDFCCLDCRADFGDPAYFYHNHSAHRQDSGHEARDRARVREEVAALTALPQADNQISEERTKTIQNWLDDTQGHYSIPIEEDATTIVPGVPGGFVESPTPSLASTQHDEPHQADVRSMSNGHKLHEYGFFIQNDGDSSTDDGDGKQSSAGHDESFDGNLFRVVDDSTSESSGCPSENAKIDSPMLDAVPALEMIVEGDEDVEDHPQTNRPETAIVMLPTVRFADATTVRYQYVEDYDGTETRDLGLSSPLTDHSNIDLLEIVTSSVPVPDDDRLAPIETPNDRTITKSLEYVERPLLTAQPYREDNVNTPIEYITTSNAMSRVVPPPRNADEMVRERAAMSDNVANKRLSNALRYPLLTPPPSPRASQEHARSSPPPPSYTPVDPNIHIRPNPPHPDHGIAATARRSSSSRGAPVLNVIPAFHALPAPAEPRVPQEAQALVVVDGVAGARKAKPSRKSSGKKEGKLSAANVAQLNEETATKAKKSRRSSFDANEFSPVAYIEGAWQAMEAAGSVATSVMSEATRKKLKGFGSRWFDRDYSLLEFYCKEGKAAAVKHLLEHRCNPGTRAKPRPKPLILAIKGASERHNKCVKALIASNCDVNAVDFRGKTPIHRVVEGPWFKGYSKLLGMLLAAGAEVDRTDAELDFPLLKLLAGAGDEPLENYQIEALALLLHPKVPTMVDVNVRQPVSHNTALHFAVKRRSPVAVAVLLHRGADVNAKNKSGTTPLLMAANQWRNFLTLEQEMTLSYLLKSPDIDVDVAGGSLGRTALHQAVAAGCAVAVEMLLERGAKASLRDKAGQDAHALLETGVSQLAPEAQQDLREALDV